MSRTAIALALCLLLAGCAAPTAQPSAVESEASATTADTASESATDSVSESTTDTASDSTSDTASDSISNSTESSDSTGASESDSATTEAAVEDRDIPITGGSLPVQHERIFDRTTQLLGVNVSPPTVIVVKPAAEIQADTGGVSTPGNGSPTRSFAGVMGIGQDEDEQSSEGGDEGDRSDDGGDDGTENDGGGDDGTKKDSDGDDDTENDSDGEDGEGEGVSVAAYAPSAHSVVVNERMTVSGREQVLERTLAHEYVHNVQFHQNAFERLQQELDLRYSYSRDRYLTYLSVVEGTAVFTAAAYDRQYLRGNWASITTPERYRSSSSGVKYAIAKYYFGSRYLDSRYDSPKNVSAVYDDPPRTTEQLLHNHTNTSEGSRPLSLRVRPGENRTLGRTNTNGELFTRIALGTELNESQAAAGAAGWGADELVPVEPANRTGNRSFVWATRWDSPAETDEFEAALSGYLASRADSSSNAEQSDGVWRDGALAFRVVRVSDETVVLLAGEDEFVRSAEISGTNASVSVS